MTGSTIKRRLKNLRNIILEIFWPIVPGIKIKNLFRIWLFQFFHALPSSVIVDKGSTVVLVGIWNILTVIKYAECVGDNGKLIIVEANNESFNILEQEVKRRNNLKDVILFNVAAWNKKGTITLEIADRPGSNKVKETQVNYAKLIGNYTDEMTMQSDTLDNILQNIGRVDHIRLNINGAELEAIDGLEKTIDSFHPSFSVLSETYHIEKEISASELVKAQLVKKGYSVICHKHMPKSPDPIYALKIKNSKKE